jgi:hypothetical protein
VNSIRSFTVAILAIAVAVGQTALGASPAFELDAASKQRLFEGAATIKEGDAYSTVVAKLGKPTHDDRLMSKQGNRFVCRSLTYYAVRWTASGVNEIHDEYVDVCLDEKDSVKSVTVKRRAQS